MRGWSLVRQADFAIGDVLAHPEVFLEVPMSVPDRNYAHLFPAFAEKVRRVRESMDAWCLVHLVGYQSALAEGFRSVGRQQQLYAQGRTSLGQIVTEKDGVHRPSNHQSGLAADFAFLHEDELTWDVPEAAWQYLQHLAHTEGLVSGSDWRNFKDQPHVEWHTSDQPTYAQAKAWRAEVGLA